MTDDVRALLSCFLVATATVAQSSVRSWGQTCFDTESRHGRFVDIDAGYLEAVVVRDDGRAFGQGQNSYDPNMSIPGSLDLSAPPLGLRFEKVRTGVYSTLALLSDGSVILLGRQFGVVPQLPPGTRYVDVDVGNAHGVLLRSDGVVLAFGDNSLGQTNVPAFPPGTVPVKVCAARATSLALMSDGSIVSFGYSGSGLTNVPALPPGVKYTDVAAGSHFITSGHVLALRSDGAVVAWGDNFYGQCNVPGLPAGTKYVLVAAGEAHSMAWRSDGVFVGWGGNFYGAFNIPTIPPGMDCVKITCGFCCTLALMSDGRILSWGADDMSSSFMSDLPRGANGEALARYRSVGTYIATIGVLSDGTLQGWGWGTSFPPPPPLTDGKFASIALGSGFMVGLLTDGNLVAWGDPTSGRTAVPPLPPGMHYVGMACGRDHTVALRSDGQAVHFGSNSLGQGNIPLPPPGVRYVQAAAHTGKTVLVRSDGQIVGLGSQDPFALSNVPPLPPGLRYVQAAAPEFYTAALRSDGTIVIWGVSGDPYASRPGWTAFPPLPFGVSYVEVNGRFEFLGARRSDGQIVVAGRSTFRAVFPPPLDPGTSYVEVDAGSYSIVGRVGPISTYVTFATGCAGSRPPARLIPMDTPRIGRELEINLFDLPADAAFVALGFARIPPLPLVPFGLPGCDLQIAIDDVALVLGQGGLATHRLPIPNRVELIGTHFFHQALVPDPAAGNAFGAVVSNAAEGVVGDQ